MYTYIFPIAGAEQAMEDLKGSGYKAERTASYKVATDCPPEQFAKVFTDYTPAPDGQITVVAPEQVQTGKTAKELYKNTYKGRCSMAFLEKADR